MENYKGYLIVGSEGTRFMNENWDVSSQNSLIYRAMSEAGTVFSVVSMQDAIELAKKQIDRRDEWSKKT